MAEVINDTIIALLCQQENDPLLIPNVSVAEIIDTRGLDDNQNKKGVFRFAHWRNQNIPVISLDVLMGGQSSYYLTMLKSS